MGSIPAPSEAIGAGYHQNQTHQSKLVERDQLADRGFGQHPGHIPHGQKPACCSMLPVLFILLGQKDCWPPQ